MSLARRSDLAHLTPEALTQLTNAGLVKRAVRELEGGYQPKLELDTNDVLTATFDDGVLTTWPRDVPILKAQCTCGAPGVCRHRIIAALAFRAQERDSESDPAPALTSPGSVDEETIAACVSPTIYSRAIRERDNGIAIEVRRRASGEPCDTARLPAATVRFWAGASLGSARCDCVQQSACEHVVLGTWAFREADKLAPEVAQQAVRLGAPASAVALDRTAYLALIAALLVRGTTGGAAALSTEISNALQAARSVRAEWLLQVIIDLESALNAYTARSATYSPRRVADLVTEIWMRLSIGALAGNAKPVLGVGQPGETELDRLRLMCLGARTFRDGENRLTRFVLADIDTGTRLALSHHWRVPADKVADEASIRTSERVVPGVRLAQLAQGQLLSQQARRLADGTLLLAKARSNQNSILPQTADWALLTQPVRFTSIKSLRDDRRTRPHEMTAPRHAAGEFVIVSCTSISATFYDPNHQTLMFTVEDDDGETIIVSRSHENHTRHALDIIASACAGAYGPIRHVAGVLSQQGGVLQMEPWAIACDQIVVPDFADSKTGALSQVDIGYAGSETDDCVATALSQSYDALSALLHHGVVHACATTLTDVNDASKQLGSVELRALANQVRQLAALARQEHAKPSGGATLAELTATTLALRQLHEDALAIEYWT
jgi:hypothetical protein